jgi:hypothetical protein
MEKPEGKISLEKLRRRWVNNVKIGLREIEWSGIYWIDRA